MEERKMEDLMIDYLEGNLTGELNEFVAKHINKSPKWASEFERLKKIVRAMENSDELIPPTSLKIEFEEMLANKIDSDSGLEQQNVTKTVYWNSPKMWMQIAASVALLIVGILGGIKLTSNANQKELVALREEMKVTKTLVLSALQNQSASSRINAVNASYTISVLDEDIINALINTMDSDENANVRIAAVDALSEFVEQEIVRSALIQSLSKQDMPVVQIALINLMVQLKEKRAGKILQQIIDDEAASNTVRDEATYGLYRL
jgi:hypothetical protein